MLAAGEACLDFNITREPFSNLKMVTRSYIWDWGAQKDVFPLSNIHLPSALTNGDGRQITTNDAHAIKSNKKK